MIRFDIYERIQLLIHLNTEDQNFVSRVYQQIQEQFPNATIHTELSSVKQYVPGSGEHVLTSGDFPIHEDVATSRWGHMFFASLGGRLWVQSDEDKYPTPFLAEAIDNVKDVRQIITDAAFAEGRSAYFRSFGVNYLGRVFSDPRTIVLLDNKKDKTLNPAYNEDISNILDSLPKSRTEERSWGSVALVSAGNVTKLEEFLGYLSETNVVAYSTGAFSKLNFMGRDFGSLTAPRADPKYGIEIMDVASRVRPPLAL